MKLSDFAIGPVFIACAAAWLVPPAARGAGPSVLDLQHEQQLGVNLCWAAVSTMAVRAFPHERPDPPITQQLTVVYGLSQVHNRMQKWITRRINFSNFEERCSDLTRCDRAFQPWLYRIDSDEVGAGKVLPEAAIAHEIRAGRPIIIRWNYGGIQPPRDGLPTGEHALIITGYDPDNHHVRIFDPWPVGPGGPSRESWVPYEVYVDPAIGLGLPVAAVHEHDIYRMRRIGKPAPANVPAPVPLASAHRLSLTPVSFVAALQGARPAIEQAMRGRVLLDREGRRRSGEFLAAQPIPIIAIPTAGLVQARARPEDLLVPQTASLLVPIIRKGSDEVVSSFLVYNDAGTWKAGGYSNTAIASRAVDVRRQRAGARDARGFYLVSIPEQSTFFLGHGQGSGAMLVSLGRDAGNAPIGARLALGGVLDSLDRDRPMTLHAAR